MTLRSRGVTSSQRADVQRQTRPKVLAVIQFVHASVGTRQGQQHLDFMVGTDLSTGAARASTVLINGKEDPCIVSLILVGKVIKSSMMGNPPCEIIQQQAQRYSHQNNGGSERMVQTIRNLSVKVPN